MKKIIFKQNKISVLWGILLFFAQALSGQNYYRLIDAASSPITSAEISSLNSVAAEAIDNLPSADRPLFKVYDVGFYAQSEYTTDGLERAWAYAQSVAENHPASEYYLVFGRENGGDRLNKNVRVELKLPTTQPYACLTAEARETLANSLAAVANENLHISYIQAQVAALQMLKDYFHQIIVCNCSSVGPDCQKYSNFKYVDAKFQDFDRNCPIGGRQY